MPSPEHHPSAAPPPPSSSSSSSAMPASPLGRGRGGRQCLPTMRKQSDFTKLLMAGFEVELNENNTQDFFVTFHGPKDSFYENGIWRVHVILPDEYPFASPSIGFVNKILHPNIDEASGSLCLNVINQTWTPIYSLVNVFEIFLPQLLLYPNAADPLNTEASSLLLKDRVKYEHTVRNHVKAHASRQAYEATSKTHREVKSSSDSATGAKQTQEKKSDAGGSGDVPTQVNYVRVNKKRNANDATRKGLVSSLLLTAAAGATGSTAVAPAERAAATRAGAATSFLKPPVLVDEDDDLLT